MATLACDTCCNVNIISMKFKSNVCDMHGVIKGQQCG